MQFFLFDDQFLSCRLNCTASAALLNDIRVLLKHLFVTVGSRNQSQRTNLVLVGLNLVRTEAWALCEILNSLLTGDYVIIVARGLSFAHDDLAILDWN